MGAHAVAVLIEAAGSALLLAYVLAALARLLGRNGVVRAQLLLAEGAVLSLGFKTGATLLRTIDLGTWHQIGLFLATLALRTLLKRAFAAERKAILRTGSGLAVPGGAGG